MSSPRSEEKILETSLSTLALKNPLVVAACPATETVKGIVACATAGAAAVVTKSIARYTPKDSERGARRTWIDEVGLWASSTWNRETLTLGQGVNLVSSAVGQVDIPVIASVTADDLMPEKWLGTCASLEEAGASMLQLDLFYAPEPLSSERQLQALRRLFHALTAEIRIPLMPKLNLTLPGNLVRAQLDQWDIQSISLLDSVYAAQPMTFDSGIRPGYEHVQRPNRSSVFGASQLPLTLHYLYELSGSGVALLGGGGVTRPQDILRLLVAGASATQLGTVILMEGYGAITEYLAFITEFCLTNRVSVSALTGCAAARSNPTEAVSFSPAHAVVDKKTCTRCGRCTHLAFCGAIAQDGARGLPLIRRSACDGCGLCQHACPANAIEVVRG